jgi:hypothetical protein
MNGATLASLASAPAPPAQVRLLTAKQENSSTLTWALDGQAARYEVLRRATVSPEWEQVQAVGNINRVTLHLSRDNVIFGVRAVDSKGHRSLPCCLCPSADRTC